MQRDNNKNKLGCYSVQLCLAGVSISYYACNWSKSLWWWWWCGGGVVVVWWWWWLKPTLVFSLAQAEHLGL